MMKMDSTHTKTHLATKRMISLPLVSQLNFLPSAGTLIRHDGTKTLNAMEAQYFSTPPSSKGTALKSAITTTPSSSPLIPSVLRLWRPSAQRNIRNQWSKLSSLKQQWASSSSNGRSYATSIVNAYLSQKYMSSMELGSLNDMLDIRNSSCLKLSKQQELYRSKLLSSYKDMVDVVVQMVNTSKLMRHYFKGSSSSTLVQFSTSSEDNDNEDAGDGGGISVFTSLTILCFEKLAEELVQMFGLELNLKRLLLMELFSIGSESSRNNLARSEELYPGEFDNLHLCNLCSKETSEPLHPTLKGHESNTPIVGRNHQPNPEVLQVYLVTWLAEVNIHTKRVDEIFELVSKEIHVSLS